MSTLITSAIISQETLLNFENSLVLANKADWQYSSKFGKSENPIGATYTLRKPINVNATENNMAWVAANSAVVENKVVLAIDRTITVPMSFTEADMAVRGVKAVEQFMSRYVAKAARTIASKLDAAVHNAIINSTAGAGANAGSGLIQSGLDPLTSAGGTPNAAGYVVGAYGTALTPATVLKARRVLMEQACPDDGEIYGVLSPLAQAELNAAQSTLFNPLSVIDDAYRNGYIGDYAGIKFAASQTCAFHTNGTLGTLAVTSGTASSGWAETATLLVSSSSGINLGDVYEAPTQYLVNPLTKALTTLKAQFQIVAVPDSTHVTVSPAPITGGAYQNISATIDSASLTLVGSTSAAGQESIVFHKEAICLASPELYLPKRAVEMAELIKNQDVDGFAIRFIRDWDTIGTSTAFGGGVGTGGGGSITRYDAYWGIKTANPAWIVRLRD